jgi:hypothetical protein
MDSKDDRLSNLQLDTGKCSAGKVVKKTAPEYQTSTFPAANICNRHFPWSWAKEYQICLL